ncbi:hypothetical protein [Synechococcus sp. A15-24]|uniref:hypothetical protein n=1 Tax=Synechococcus sp. A15-24 TaxID=1050635 RepID=UPI00164426D2|nr:hypothetical protein [Synechococcus sp. A15-24]QNJ29409.1 hypothetical protein SynA1524_01714 [Synechococcus sp. A15-24]
MELLGFLLSVLAIAFVVAKLVFNRKAHKARSPRRIRTPSFREPPSSGLKAEASETPTPDSSELEARTPKASEPPLVETTEFGVDWYIEQGNAGKTFGEILGIMFPQTLVGGKQTWEVLKDAPENKHDLDLMLACCKAEMESSQINIWFPAPAYFKRVAIILRKQKDYAREIGIIELYWQLCDRVYEAKREDGDTAQMRTRQLSAIKSNFQHRYDKAKQLLEKQRARLKPDSQQPAS